MNKEDYVSLEVAKLLQKKGFRESCNAIYSMNRSGNSSLQIMFCLNHFEYLLKYNDGFQCEYLAPTLYEAQKWLREKHNIDVLPVIKEGSSKKDYCCYVYKNAKAVRCKVAYGEDFYECINDGLIEALKLI